MQPQYPFQDLIPQLVPLSIFNTLIGLGSTVVLFLLFSLPFRLAIYYSKNYQIAIRSRQISNWILVIAVLWMSYLLLQLFSFLIRFEALSSGDMNPYRSFFLPMSFALMFMVPLFYIFSAMMGKMDFFSVNHIPYLRYFILYLRSFKDDNRRSPSEMRLMYTLAKIYQPFAIGQPNEFMPPRGAKRIYVGDDWKEQVMEMQHKAPIMLQRINLSENYLWEFEQCVSHGYLNKVIFWVVNYEEYEGFQKYCKEKHDLDFPILEAKKGIETLFYLREDGSFRIHVLESPEAYDQLINLHREDHPHHLQENLSYFWKRDSHLLWEAIDPRYDKQIMPGINRMSWVGLLFPKYYLICHRIRWRIPFYLLFTGIHAIESLFPTTLYQLASIRMLTNVLLAYVFCRNGRRLVWLSERWESKEYYEKIYRRNTFWAVFFGILFNLLWIWGARNGIAIRIR